MVNLRLGQTRRHKYGDTELWVPAWLVVGLVVLVLTVVVIA